MKVITFFQDRQAGESDHITALLPLDHAADKVCQFQLFSNKN